MRWLIGRVLMIAISAMAGGVVTVSNAASTIARHLVVERNDNGTKIQIGATVRGEGRLVVMVPSLGRGGADFADLAERLAQAGYQTVAIDPRGVGDSHGPLDTFSVAAMTEDVLAVARHLSDKPAVYLGHAFGNGAITPIDFYHPEYVSALILIAGGGARTQPGIDAHALLETVFNDSLPTTERMAAVQTAFFAKGNDATVWRDGWYPALYRAQMAPRERVIIDLGKSSSKAPILEIQAAEDQITPPQAELSKRSAYPDRDVEVKTIPHAGHALLPEQPQLLADTVLDFLKRKLSIN